MGFFDSINPIKIIQRELDNVIGEDAAGIVTPILTGGVSLIPGVGGVGGQTGSPGAVLAGGGAGSVGASLMELLAGGGSDEQIQSGLLRRILQGTGQSTLGRIESRDAARDATRNSGRTFTPEQVASFEAMARSAQKAAPGTTTSPTTGGVRTTPGTKPSTQAVQAEQMKPQVTHVGTGIEGGAPGVLPTGTPQLNLGDVPGVAKVDYMKFLQNLPGASGAFTSSFRPTDFTGFQGESAFTPTATTSQAALESRLPEIEAFESALSERLGKFQGEQEKRQRERFAERGLMGSGALQDAQSRLSENISGEFGRQMSSELAKQMDAIRGEARFDVGAAQTEAQRQQNALAQLLGIGEREAGRETQFGQTQEQLGAQGRENLINRVMGIAGTQTAQEQSFQDKLRQAQGEQRRLPMENFLRQEGFTDQQVNRLNALLRGGQIEEQAITGQQKQQGQAVGGLMQGLGALLPILGGALGGPPGAIGGSVAGSMLSNPQVLKI